MEGEVDQGVRGKSQRTPAHGLMDQAIGISHRPSKAPAVAGDDTEDGQQERQADHAVVDQYLEVFVVRHVRAVNRLVEPGIGGAG